MLEDEFQLNLISLYKVQELLSIFQGSACEDNGENRSPRYVPSTARAFHLGL